SPFVTPGKQGNIIFPTLTGPGFWNSDLSLFKNFTFGQSESKKLQFRFSGYNFLNHPNRTFIAGDPNLTLNFTSNGTLNTTNQRFGFADNTIGHRILQGMIKFTWWSWSLSLVFAKGRLGQAALSFLARESLSRTSTSCLSSSALRKRSGTGRRGLFFFASAKLLQHRCGLSISRIQAVRALQHQQRCLVVTQHVERRAQ